MAGKKAEDKKAQAAKAKETVVKKRRGRKKNIANNESFFGDDELNSLSKDSDFLKISDSKVKIASDRVAEKDDFAPLFEEDVEEQAVKELKTGKFTEHELSSDKLYHFDEITDSPFKVGDMVCHDKFGEGEIVGQYGDVELLKVYVHFENTAGEPKTRLFMVEKANLKKVKKKRSK